jgi:Mn-dependent DtxR family transcriptional regulator
VRRTALTRNGTAKPLSDLTRVEDYLEVIYDLIQTKGYARAVDIAERLGVKTPSVTCMIQKLDRMGLVVYQRYRGLTLTQKGVKTARFTQRKHVLILKFLQLFRIEEEAARKDAEGIEHHVHKDTLNRIANFVEFVNDHPTWFKNFQTV